MNENRFNIINYRKSTSVRPALLLKVQKIFYLIRWRKERQSNSLKNKTSGLVCDIFQIYFQFVGFNFLLGKLIVWRLVGL